jgi:DNA-binding transcriptional ArsR family regulator
MKVSNTSAQLRALAGAGLVASRRDGLRIYYRLAEKGHANGATAALAITAAIA